MQTEAQVAQEKVYRTEILTAYDRRNSVEEGGDFGYIHFRCLCLETLELQIDQRERIIEATEAALALKLKEIKTDSTINDPQRLNEAIEQATQESGISFLKTNLAKVKALHAPVNVETGEERQVVRQLRSVLGPPQERREAIVQARLEFRKAEMLEFLADAAMEPQESTEEQVAQEKAYRTEILTAYDRRNSVDEGGDFGYIHFRSLCLETLELQIDQRERIIEATEAALALKLKEIKKEIKTDSTINDPQRLNEAIEQATQESGISFLKTNLAKVKALYASVSVETGEERQVVRQLRSVLGPPRSVLGTPQEIREAIVQARLEFRKAEMLEFLAPAYNDTSDVLKDWIKKSSREDAADGRSKWGAKSKLAGVAVILSGLGVVASVLAVQFAGVASMNNIALVIANAGILAVNAAAGLVGAGTVTALTSMTTGGAIAAFFGAAVALVIALPLTYVLLSGVASGARRMWNAAVAAVLDSTSSSVDEASNLPNAKSKVEPAAQTVVRPRAATDLHDRSDARAGAARTGDVSEMPEQKRSTPGAGGRARADRVLEMRLESSPTRGQQAAPPQLEQSAEGSPARRSQSPSAGG